MNDCSSLKPFSSARALAERDLAMGNFQRARRRSLGVIEALLGCCRREEPEMGSWLRIISALAQIEKPPPPAAQLPLWPDLHAHRSADWRPLPPRSTFITTDVGLRRHLKVLERLAPTTLPVLLEGESGTGKEVIARIVHEMSPRVDGPWVPVNCGAIPAQLQESELFGHARGAYTGATMKKPGLFEAADGGTLFLDEIGEMDPRAQVKLLRVLENGELRRLGEVRMRRVAVRVVAATNADVDAAVAAGRFRADLLFRLGAVRFTLSPLRERAGDILPLAQHFLRGCSARFPLLTPGAQTALLRHPWPGNARELKFVIERAVALWEHSGQGEIADEMLMLPRAARALEEAGAGSVSAPSPCRLQDMPGGCDLEGYLATLERQLILEALEQAGGNRTLAARFLGGMRRTTLIGKMKRHGLFRPVRRGA